MDIRTKINQLCLTVFLDNRRKGFWEKDEGYASVATKLALIHGEVSEALEAARLPQPAQDKHLPGYSNFAVELADIVIRVFDLAGRFGIPLGEIILAKIEFNRTREPKHGKLF